MTVEKSLYLGYVKAMFNGLGFIFIALGTWFLFQNVPGLPLLKFIPFVILTFAMMTYPTTSATTEEEIGLSMMRAVIGFLMVVIFSLFSIGSMMGLNSLLWISLSSIAAAFFLTFPVVEAKGVTGAGAEILNKIYRLSEKIGEGIERGIKKADPSSGIIGQIIKYVIYAIIGFIVLIVLLQFLGIGLGLLSITTNISQFLVCLCKIRIY